MTDLLKSRETLVWLVLMFITGVSWLLGANHNLIGGDSRYGALVLMLLAFFKVRLVIMNFMEIRHANLGLRLACEAWVLASGLAVIAMIAAAL